MSKPLPFTPNPAGSDPGERTWQGIALCQNDLLAWLKDKDMDVDRPELKTTLASAGAFLLRFRDDGAFQQKVKSISTDTEFMEFARQEGFTFTFQELEEAIKVGPDDGLAEKREARIPRRAQRYQVYLKVSELNGQPVTDTMILDINAWGARIGSFSPFDALGSIEITFNPPGETQHVHITGEVVWSRLMPAEGQYHAGIEFTKSIDQLHREGKI
jgi:predicted ribosomally synthesized peptide with nif11-like leader